VFTHDLVLLINRYCIPYGIKVPRNIMKNAHTYTTWEAESRYSLHFSIRKDSLIKAITEVENWLIEINPKYKKTISIYRSKYNL